LAELAIYLNFKFIRSRQLIYLGLRIMALGSPSPRDDHVTVRRLACGERVISHKAGRQEGAASKTCRVVPKEEEGGGRKKNG